MTNYRYKRQHTRWRNNMKVLGLVVFAWFIAIVGITAFMRVALWVINYPT